MSDRIIHELKTIPSYFKAIARGEKNFEIRDNSDRGFQKGDRVVLKEFNPRVGPCGSFSGNEIVAVINYVTNFKQKDGYIVFGFTVLDRRFVDRTPIDCF